MDVEMMETNDMKHALKPPAPSPDSHPSHGDLQTGGVTCSTIFNRNHKEVEPLFFQMPDTLPGLPVVEEEEDKKPTIVGANGEKPPKTASKKVLVY